MPDAAISVVAGTKLSISTTPITDATLAAFTAGGRVYTQVQGVSELSAFGDKREVVSFQQIDGSRVRKRIGTSDAGTLEITVGRDPADAGQILMRAAANSKALQAIKIELADMPTGGTKNTVFYVCGVVSGAQNNMAGPNEIVTTTFSVELDAAPVIVEAV